MELEKSDNDILGNLYALRGGLSAISAEYDMVRKADADFYEKLNCVADQAGGARYEAPKGTVEYSMWLINNGFENELNRRLHSIKEKAISDNNSKNDEAEARIAKKKANKYFVVFSLLFIAGGAAFGLALFLISIMFKGIFQGSFTQVATNVFALLIFFAPSIVALIFSFVFLGKGVSNSRLSKKYRELAETKKDLAKAEEILDRNEVSEKRTAAINNLDKLPMVRSNARRVLGERNAAINPMVQSCNVFYNALKEQFNWLLDERDWQYLDLIIYQIETRRADSVKEALQLVDRELQTERIQRSLGEATQAICHTLARGFSQLQSTINVCCERICSRLDDISNQLDYMSAQMTVQSIQLAGIGGQLAALTDSVNVNNALRAKANVTSAQLCSEVHAVMQYR